MVTEILMGLLIVIGLVIAIPGLMELEFIKKMFSKKVVTNKPEVVITIPDSVVVTPDVAPTQTPYEPRRRKLAYIIEEWEAFVDVLVANGMEESAEDMKSLLNKMVSEYRNELNENDDNTVAMIDSIIEVSPEKKGE